MSVLVTGAGLVGSQVARLELKRGERVVVLDNNVRVDALGDIVDLGRIRVVRGDILNPYDIARVTREEKVKSIVHTAAYPLLTLGAQSNPQQAINVNVMGTCNVLEAARLFDVRRVVFASSNVIDTYVTEGAFGMPRPSSIYATSKLACEHMGLNYADWLGVDFVAVRFAAVFGPWRYGGGGGPTQLFKTLIENSLRGKRAELPRETLEYVYSIDAARGAVFACHATGLRDRVFNITMNRLYGPEEIKEIVESVLPKARISLIDRARSGPTRRKQSLPSDGESARQQLGYVPRYEMRRAIREYAAWSRRLVLGNSRRKSLT